MKDCGPALKEHDKKVAAAEEALKGTRTQRDIQGDMKKLALECGPKDPAPGAASTPVEIPAVDPVSEPSCEFKVWHEGCIELLWVQGTSTRFPPDSVSNPVTKTIKEAMAGVNSIWAQCCVRFKVFLKIVPVKDLGTLNNKDSGIFVDAEGTVTSVDKDKIDKGYTKVVKDLQDHDECAGLLVVDDVVGNAAGFAQLGGKAGIITMGPNMVNGIGFVAAHEIGHAVGGIDHGTHKHGELMWGEGCEGYPDREEYTRYWNVTPTDCESMRSKTTPTKEPCPKPLECPPERDGEYRSVPQDGEYRSVSPDEYTPVQPGAFSRDAGMSVLSGERTLY